MLRRALRAFPEMGRTQSGRNAESRNKVNHLDQIADAAAKLRAVLPSIAPDDLRYDLLRAVNEAELAARYKRDGLYEPAVLSARDLLERLGVMAERLENDTPGFHALCNALEGMTKLPPISKWQPPEVDPNAIGDEMDRGYHFEKFRVGEQVTIAPKEILMLFLPPRRIHHPLEPEQLRLAGLTTTVHSLGFYFGGDVLYRLTDTEDFVWHEECLQSSTT